MNNKTILKRLFFVAFTILVSNISMAQNDDLGTSQDQPFPECTTPKKLKIKVDGKHAYSQKINNKPLYELCYGEELTLSQSEDITPDQTEWASPDFAGYAIKWFEGVESTRLLNMSNAQVVLNGKVNEHTITYDDSYIGVDELPVVLYAVDALYLDGSCKTSDTVYIKFNPVPTAKYRDDHPEFCEGKAAGAVSLDFVGGAESDYKILWYSGTDIATGSSIGVDLGVDFFEGLNGTENGGFHEFVYKLIDKETGCESEEQSYTVTVYPAPEAPEEETIEYTINGDQRWLIAGEKFLQTLNSAYELVWFQNQTDPDSRGSIDGETVDRTQEGEKTVYIAYKDGECYSERVPVLVKVLSVPVPGVKDVDLCKDGTFDPMDGIAVTDDPDYELIWFVDGSDTTGKALTTPPTNAVDVTTPGQYTLYVAQRMKTSPYAQSDVVSFDVIVYGVMAPVDASRHEYCAHEMAEELKAVRVTDEKNYFYSDEIVFVSGATEYEAVTPDTRVNSTMTYDYEAYQTYTAPISGNVCKGTSIPISVDVYYVSEPTGQKRVNYTQAEGVSGFVTIPVKNPQAINDITDPGYTLLWAKNATTSAWCDAANAWCDEAKPTYDALALPGSVQKQTRYAKWKQEVVSGKFCESKPVEVEITISSQSGIEDIISNDVDAIVNVYTISGALVKSNVKRSEALNGLANGAYVIGGQKVVVNK